MARQAVYLCAEEAGGCGVVWTPTTGSRRPVQKDPKWAWCPDCLRAQQAEQAEGGQHERAAAG